MHLLVMVDKNKSPLSLFKFVISFDAKLALRIYILRAYNEGKPSCYYSRCPFLYGGMRKRSVRAAVKYLLILLCMEDTIFNFIFLLPVKCNWFANNMCCVCSWAGKVWNSNKLLLQRCSWNYSWYATEII